MSRHRECVSHTNVIALDAETAVAGACRRAEIGCTDCKQNLSDGLDAFLTPFRERRAAFEQRPGIIRDILNLGGSEARVEGQKTLEMVKDAMGLTYRNLLG